MLPRFFLFNLCLQSAFAFWRVRALFEEMREFLSRWTQLGQRSYRSPPCISGMRRTGKAFMNHLMMYIYPFFYNLLPKCNSDSCTRFRFVHGAHYGSISGVAAWQRVAIEQNELSGALLPFDSLSVSISNMLADQKRSHRRSASAASLASTSSVASAPSDVTDQ